MSTLTTNPIDAPADQGSRPARRVLRVAAALGIALLAFAAINWFGLGNDAESGPAQPALQLSLGDGPGLASCAVFDVATLSGMSPAFAGTVASVDGETVTLDVDRWYAGEEAAQVVLHATAGQEALIGGIDFQAGQRYLITAAGGNVNYCGYSGPATPELTAAFEQAFPA